MRGESLLHIQPRRRPTAAGLPSRSARLPSNSKDKPAVLSLPSIYRSQTRRGAALQGDRLAALGTLAGGMAHAINNPLTYVLLNLEDLSEQLPKLAEQQGFMQEAVQRLKEAHDGAERVAHVVRQMRAFARSESSAAAAIDVREVLDAALALVGNEIRHRGNLVTEYEDVPLVFAAQARLEQALLNLLLHAARALPDPNVAPPDVRVALRREGENGVLIEVTYATPDDHAVEQGPFDPLSSISGSVDAGLAIATDRHVARGEMRSVASGAPARLFGAAPAGVDPQGVSPSPRRSVVHLRRSRARVASR